MATTPTPISKPTSIKLSKERGYIATILKFINPATLISLIGLFSIALYEHNFDFSLMGNILIEVLKEFFIAVFVVGSVAIFMELNHFGSHLITSLRDIMATDDFINELEVPRLKDLKCKVDKRLYFGDETNDPNSFFYVVENEVSNYLNECYYEEYINDVECIIDEDEDYIKKVITRMITIKNPTSSIKVKTVPVGAYMTQIDGIQDIDLYKITKCKITIGNQTINKNIKLTTEKCLNQPSNSPTYEIEVSGQFSIEIEDSCNIELVAESFVPKSDIHYQHRVTAPCKRFSSNFLLKTNEPYRVTGFGFGFVDEKKLKIIPYKNINGVRIEFNGWILPGDGVIFTIAKDMV